MLGGKYWCSGRLPYARVSQKVEDRSKVRFHFWKNGKWPKEVDLFYPSRRARWEPLINRQYNARLKKLPELLQGQWGGFHPFFFWPAGGPFRGLWGPLGPNFHLSRNSLSARTTSQGSLISAQYSHEVIHRLDWSLLLSMGLIQDHLGPQNGAQKPKKTEPDAKFSKSISPFLLLLPIDSSHSITHTNVVRAFMGNDYRSIVTPSGFYPPLKSCLDFPSLEIQGWLKKP